MFADLKNDYESISIAEYSKWIENWLSVLAELVKLEGEPVKQCSMIRNRYPYLPDDKDNISVEELLIKHKEKK